MPLGLKPGGAPQGDPGPRQAAGGLLPGPCCGRAAQLRLPGPRGPRCVRPGPGAHPRAPPRRPGAAPLLRAWQWRRPRRLPPAPRSLAAPLHVTERGPPGAALCVRGTGEAARRPDGSGRGGGSGSAPTEAAGPAGTRRPPPPRPPLPAPPPRPLTHRGAGGGGAAAGRRRPPCSRCGRTEEGGEPPANRRAAPLRPRPPPRWPGGARGGGGREGRGRARREEPSGNSRARRAVRHAGVTSCARRHDVIAQAPRPPPRTHTHTRPEGGGRSAHACGVPAPPLPNPLPRPGGGRQGARGPSRPVSAAPSTPLGPAAPCGRLGAAPAGAQRALPERGVQRGRPLPASGLPAGSGGRSVCCLAVPFPQKAEK